MLAKDRLHVVALIITSIAVLTHYIGVLLPNWWVLRQSQRIVTVYSLFGDISCSDTICYPEDLSIVPVPEGKDPPQGFGGENADWLRAGRVLLVLGSVSVLATVVLQMVFINLRNYRALQVMANSFLIFTALVDFIAGFLFIGKFATLSRVYSETRPVGALNYTPAPVGLILFASLLCVVAAVFTTLAFKPPVQDPRFK